jgi:hypothetical protein
MPTSNFAISFGELCWAVKTSGLYYKHVTIINDASSVVNKLKASLNDAARGVIYEHHMFIAQATDLRELTCKCITENINSFGKSKQLNIKTLFFYLLLKRWVKHLFKLISFKPIF